MHTTNGELPRPALPPTQLHTIFGNSQITLPKFVELVRATEPALTCDIVLVDGGHRYELTWDDITNFGKLAILYDFFLKKFS